MTETQTLVQMTAIERFLGESARAARVADVLRAATRALADEVPGALVARPDRAGNVRVRATAGSCAGLDGAVVRSGPGRREPEEFVPAGANRGGAFHVAAVSLGRGDTLLAVHLTDGSAEEPASLRTLALVMGSEIERIRASRAAAAAQRELKHLRGRNGFLIRGVSHDLKNPIGAIDGYMQLLDAGVRGELSDGQREWTGRIGRALQSMLALINDLLDLARVDSNALAFEQQPLPLPAIVREAMQSVQPLAERSGIRIETEIPTGLPPVLADLSRVRQTIDKVLGFALRTIREGDVLRCAMSIDTAEAGAHVIALRFVFPSCPANPADQARLLEGLVKTEPAPGREAGTGLEIALARRLARAMDGDLAFTTEGDLPAMVLHLPAAPPQ